MERKEKKGDDRGRAAAAKREILAAFICVLDERVMGLRARGKGFPLFPPLFQNRRVMNTITCILHFRDRKRMLAMQHKHLKQQQQ